MSAFRSSRCCPECVLGSEGLSWGSVLKKRLVPLVLAVYTVLDKLSTEWTGWLFAHEGKYVTMMRWT